MPQRGASPKLQSWTGFETGAWRRQPSVRSAQEQRSLPACLLPLPRPRAGCHVCFPAATVACTDPHASRWPRLPLPPAGLVVIIALLGYGLVEIPRIFWRRSWPETRLKWHYHRVGRAADKLTDARCGPDAGGGSGWPACLRAGPEVVRPVLAAFCTTCFLPPTALACSPSAPPQRRAGEGAGHCVGHQPAGAARRGPPATLHGPHHQVRRGGGGGGGGTAAGACRARGRSAHV